MKIKQGDAYSLPVRVELNGAAIAAEDAAEIEFYIGGYRKIYPGEVTYSAEDGFFYIPLTQSETFAWAANSAVQLDARVKFSGGDVRGLEKMTNIGVVDAISEEEL